jgi:hypothetical protein
MKVWEKLNQLKGTNATIDTISNWFYINRIYPNDILTYNALELNNIPEWLINVCNKWDSEVLMRGQDAIYEMLNEEVEE